MGYDKFPDFPTKMDAFQKFCEKATGVKVVWGNGSGEGRKREALKTWAELYPISFKSLGSELVYLDTDEGLIPHYYTTKLLRIQTTFRARSQEHKQSAWLSAEMLQTKFNNRDLKDKNFKFTVKDVAGNPYECTGLSVAEIGDVINLPGGFYHDDRIEGMATIEVALNTVVLDVDEDNAISWIENIELSSKIKNVDGSAFPDSLQAIDEVMP